MKFDALMVVYQGSNGDATKALYDRLAAYGPPGFVALNLFRACKASERAKVYSRRYRGTAYDKKEWSMGLLCEALAKDAAGLGLAWGWGYDAKTVNFEHVLYVETPHGQVSFHCAQRMKGPDYPGQWDGAAGTAPARICRWIEDILEKVPA